MQRNLIMGGTVLIAIIGFFVLQNMQLGSVSQNLHHVCEGRGVSKAAEYNPDRRAVVTVFYTEAENPDRYQKRASGFLRTSPFSDYDSDNYRREDVNVVLCVSREPAEKAGSCTYRVPSDGSRRTIEYYNADYTYTLRVAQTAEILASGEGTITRDPDAQCAPQIPSFLLEDESRIGILGIDSDEALFEALEPILAG